MAGQAVLLDDREDLLLEGKCRGSPRGALRMAIPPRDELTTSDIVKTMIAHAQDCTTVLLFQVPGSNCRTLLLPTHPETEGHK